MAIISRINLQGEKEYLLVSTHEDRGEHTGKYYPPGGGIEVNETEEQALARELWEELKVTGRPVHKIASIKGDMDGLILHFWEYELNTHVIELKVNELVHAGWFTVNQMKNLRLYPASLRIFREFLGVDI